MAYVVKRGGRYTGYYRKDGKRVSAGTWDTEKEALAHALMRETSAVETASKAAMRLDEYIDEWLTTADLLPITKKGYESVLKRYVLPVLGSRKVSAVTRKSVRELLDRLRAQGVGSATVAQCKAALGSAYRPLLESEEVAVNPTHGIRVRKNTADLRNVLDIEEFKAIADQLPTDAARLFAQFLVVSGCRFGEATELRVGDINLKTGEVYVQRRVSEIGSKRNDGCRFLVVDATKSGHKRYVMLSQSLVNELREHIRQNGLQQSDLLFSKTLVQPADKVVPKSRDLPPFKRGYRVFHHGTLYAYTTGGCRCEDCKAAAREHRRSLRSRNGVPRRNESNKTNHLPRDLWRTIWNRAIANAGIEWRPRTHDLRHANATQLLKNGVDVHEVKERLGHQSIKTTERYLHRLRHQQSKAAGAVDGYLE